MFDSEDILYAARILQPYLAEMVGEQAESVQWELDSLLEKEKKGERVENLILDLLSRYEASREWMRSALVTQETITKSHQGLPGLPGAIPAGSIFTCPELGCPVVWTVRKAGQPVPRCPHHHSYLKPVPK